MGIARRRACVLACASSCVNVVYYITFPEYKTRKQRWYPFVRERVCVCGWRVACCVQAAENVCMLCVCSLVHTTTKFVACTPFMHTTGFECCQLTTDSRLTIISRGTCCVCYLPKIKEVKYVYTSSSAWPGFVNTRLRSNVDGYYPLPKSKMRDTNKMQRAYRSTARYKVSVPFEKYRCQKSKFKTFRKLVENLIFKFDKVQGKSRSWKWSKNSFFQNFF